jgi:large conductance mechanosensitive channel
MKFIKEFKEFATQGSLMDIAVGMIIGAAFTAIVTSLVDDIISPVIGMFMKSDFSDLVATVNGVDIAYGKFIMALVNFIIVAFVIFCMVKAIAKAKGFGKEEEEVSPETKICEFCKSEVPIEATRCPHCTSELPPAPEEEAAVEAEAAEAAAE